LINLRTSIRNKFTGEDFLVEINPTFKSDFSQVTKVKGWLFLWKKEFQNSEKKVYKLITIKEPNVIQGLLSLSFKSNYIVIELIENAPFNRSKNKIYEGVMGNLVAFACKLSFENGGDGCVSFLAKTNLVEHYKKALGAIQESGQLMVIYPEQAAKLVKQYYTSNYETE